MDRDILARKKPNKVKFSDAFVRNLRAGEKAYIIWDTHQKGFCIRVQPSGSRAYKLSYNLRNRTRWFTIGGADAIALADARRIAAELMLQVIRGGDPQAERRAKRGTGAFAELAERYLEEHAKRKNKSWAQGAALIAKHLTPKWAKLGANSITRSDVKAALSRITKDSVAKQTLAAVSAVFSWAVKEEIAGVTANPCTGITYEKARSRERILSNSEVKMFWDAFDCAGLIAGSALKVILLTGQRPGEVCAMHRSNIVDGCWWNLPGRPVPALCWPGTKNGENHRAFLPKAARNIIDEVGGDGLIFATDKRRPITHLDAAMRKICADLAIAEGVTPHDLRRTHGTFITRLGFGRDAMNRVQNHKEGGIASVYDRHDYAAENRNIMETVAERILALAAGEDPESNVVLLKTG